MRQFKFTDQVHRLGWTSPTFQGSHPEFIIDSITEYHLFLDISKPTLRSLVPTLSIDLSWHTHMLSGERYHEDCLRVLDRFLDHDDRVEEGILGELTEHLPTSMTPRTHQLPCHPKPCSTRKHSKFGKRSSSQPTGTSPPPPQHQNQRHREYPTCFNSPPSSDPADPTPPPVSTLFSPQMTMLSRSAGAA